MVNKFGQIKLNIKECGKIIKRMEKEFYIIQMETYLKERLLIKRLQERENIFIKMGLYFKEIG